MTKGLLLFFVFFGLSGSPGIAQSPAPPVVPPASGAPPVVINSCGPRLASGSNASGPSILGIPLTSTSEGISIEFVNNSSAVATLVNFAVDSNGDHFIIRDVGTFSPGISIKHNYRNGSGQGFVLPAFISPKVTCSVASVKFADGSFWRKGQAQAPIAPPPPANGSLSVTPAQLEIDRGTDSALFFVQSTARVAGFKETDSCAGIASVFVVASGDMSVTYSVKPIAPGTCSAQISDESGASTSLPIVVR